MKGIFMDRERKISSTIAAKIASDGIRRILDQSKDRCTIFISLQSNMERAESKKFFCKKPPPEAHNYLNTIACRFTRQLRSHGLRRGLRLLAARRVPVIPMKRRCL